MRFIALILACLFSWSALAQVPMTGAGKGAPSGGGGVSGWCSKIPQSGLVNCWPFDSTYTTSGTAQDPIGGKNATLSNVTLNGSGPSSNLNNAGVFDGSISNGTTLLANVPTSTFSIVIWLNANAGSAGGNRPFANCHTDSDSNGFEIEAGFTAQPVIVVGNGTTNTSATNTSSLAASTWTMLTFTYDGSLVTPYFNTTASTGQPFTGPLTNCSTNIAFGFNPAYAGDFFFGLIAGVAIYNRALTSGEVTTINGL